MIRNKYLAFIITILVFGSNAIGQKGDAALTSIRVSDRADKLAKTKDQLTPAEHLRRAGIYLANRLFDDAREHFQAIVSNYPNDPTVPPALLGMARSFYVERRYEEARQTYDRLARTFPDTKEGREGLNFAASSLLRMGRGAEAAAIYAEYISKYPNGERIDTAHLNAIDAYREAGRVQDAIAWIDRTRQRFAGTPTESAAIFTRLRLDLTTGNWQHAVESADELLQKPGLTGSNTTTDEVIYLKAHALERAGRLGDAWRTYLLIPDGMSSYYGGLATDRLRKISDPAVNQVGQQRAANVNSAIENSSADYPAAFRFQVLKEAKKRNLDPRLLLSIMKQESQFKPGARSPSAARGLLQLTIDAANKFGERAGFDHVTEDMLYRPDVNIAVGAEYVAELSRMFAGLPEAIAASYNGGEDNVARWLARSNQKDEGVFASEVGFTESKNYVFKVMNYYRAYRQLYTADLKPRAAAKMKS
jgi:soluble lytic murein transglycosylase-like protein/outer membrane protein assembly factor BamD (BamD/ComL family)